MHSHGIYRSSRGNGGGSGGGAGSSDPSSLYTPDLSRPSKHHSGSEQDSDSDSRRIRMIRRKAKRKQRESIQQDDDEIEMNGHEQLIGASRSKKRFKRIESMSQDISSVTSSSSEIIDVSSDDDVEITSESDTEEKQSSETKQLESSHISSEQKEEKEEEEEVKQENPIQEKEKNLNEPSLSSSSSHQPSSLDPSSMSQSSLHRPIRREQAEPRPSNPSSSFASSSSSSSLPSASVSASASTVPVLRRPAVKMGQSEPIPISIFEETWPAKSPADNYCFLCERGDQPDKLLKNRYYQTLARLMSQYGTISTLKLCQIIQQFYQKQFQPHQPGQPEWTLNSIRQHVEHDGISPEGMIRNVTRVIHKQITTLSETGLSLYDPDSGKIFANSRGTNYLIKLSRSLVSCARR